MLNVWQLFYVVTDRNLALSGSKKDKNIQLQINLLVPDKALFAFKR
jgi:hypothetical protein